MNLFKRLFRRAPIELPPMIQSCAVYYSPRGVVVSANSRDVRGWNVPGPPLSMLSGQAPNDEIGSAILTALVAVLDGLPTQEYDLQTQKLFNLMSEINWDSLEKHWEFINVHCDSAQQTVTISPLHRYANGGYGGQKDDPIYQCNFDASEVGELIRKIISGPPPQLLHEEPSHT